LAPRSTPIPFYALLTLTTTKAATKSAKSIQVGRQLQKLGNLQIQSILMQALRDALPSTELASWSSHISLITTAISNFSRKALLRCLPTNSNLHRWDRSKPESCPQCGESETEKHVLNNCSASAVEGRYTWRHNAVLRFLVDYIATHLPSSHQLFADLPDKKNPTEIYTDILPDITVVHGNIAHILELTCCYETNLVTSRDYKLEKYRTPILSCKEKFTFHVHTLEVSSLGFVSTGSLRKFLTSIGIPSLPVAEVRHLGEIALRSSYFIFSCRHKPWPNDMTDPYFHH